MSDFGDITSWDWCFKCCCSLLYCVIDDCRQKFSHDVVYSCGILHRSWNVTACINVYKCFWRKEAHTIKHIRSWILYHWIWIRIIISSELWMMWLSILRMSVTLYRWFDWSEISWNLCGSRSRTNCETASIWNVLLKRRTIYWWVDVVSSCISLETRVCDDW